MKKLVYFVAIISFPLSILPLSTSAGSLSDSDLNLMKMDFDDLMSLKLSSVDKRQQNLGEIAAAVTVLSQEDIRRSGTTSIAELMRLVPGYIVTRIDSNKWSVSSSEDSNRLADDMTVMIDNRPVYSSFFGGTFWEHIDLVFEDIERIEVIRGPAGKIWGTNMNRGVVNIITKSSKDTHGILVSLSGGTEERGQAAVRYGGQLGDNLNFRIFAKATERDASWADNAADDSHNGQIGLRADWQPSKHDNVMLHTGLYKSKNGQRITVPSIADINESETLTEDAKFTSFFAVTQWQHQISETASIETNVFYDYIRRDEISIFNERDRVGLNFSNNFSLPWNQKVLWGFYYLNERDRSKAGRVFAMQPANNNLETYMGYLQDEVSFLDDSLRVSVGASVIKHTFITQPEFQPSLRMAWMPSKKQTLWLAVTRSFQMPNRLEKNGLHWIMPDEDNAFEAGQEWIQLKGNPQQHAEESTGFQIGYRGTFSTFSWDLTGYLITERDAPHQSLADDGNSVIYHNGGKENIYGTQVALDWKPFSWWHLKPAASYMFIEEIDHNDDISGNEDPEFLEEAGWPSYQVTLRSLMDLSPNWELDTTFRYVDKLQGTQIKGYFNMDARLGWKPTQNWELSLVGQNLLQNHHAEANATFFPTQSAEIERGIYARVLWRY